MSARTVSRQGANALEFVTLGEFAKRTPPIRGFSNRVDELRESHRYVRRRRSTDAATEINQSALDSALSSAMSAAGRVKSEHSWLKTQLHRFTTQWGGGRGNPGLMSLEAIRQFVSRTLAEWRTIRLADLQFWHRGEGQLALYRRALR